MFLLLPSFWVRFLSLNVWCAVGNGTSSEACKPWTSQVCAPCLGLLPLPREHAPGREPRDKRHGCGGLPLQSFYRRLEKGCPGSRTVSPPLDTWVSPAKINRPAKPITPAGSVIKAWFYRLQVFRIQWWLVLQHWCDSRWLTHSSFKITTCHILSKPFTFMSLSLPGCKIEIISSPLGLFKFVLFSSN